MKILIKVKMFARFRSRLIPMKSKFILSISLGELQLLQLYSHLHQHHENRPELSCHLRHSKPNSAKLVITSKMCFFFFSCLADNASDDPERSSLESLSNECFTIHRLPCQVNTCHQNFYTISACLALSESLYICTCFLTQISFDCIQ